MFKKLEGFSGFARRWTPVALWLVFIVFFSSDWGSSSMTLRFFKPIFLWFNPHLTSDQLGEMNLLIRKIAHVTQFAILAILTWRACRRSDWFGHRGGLYSARITLTLAFIFAIAGEVIQLFIPSRTPKIADVFLNFGGACLGLVIVWIHRRTHGQPGDRPPRKILFTSDLHLTESTAPATLDHLRDALDQTGCDTCVLVGDTAPATQAAHWLPRIKEALAPREVIFCLGNHDHWLEPGAQPLDFPAIRASYWQPALAVNGLRCLDFGNVVYDGLVLTGGYGHYDLHFRDPEVEIDRARPALDDYRAGAFAGIGWNDMAFIPHSTARLEAEAASQSEQIAERLAAAIATRHRVVVVTHTAPFFELVGSHSPLRGFTRAYAGNSAIGHTLAGHADEIAFAVCSHTHSVVPPAQVRGVFCANIGSHPSAPRFIIYETSSGKAFLAG